MSRYMLLLASALFALALAAQAANVITVIGPNGTTSSETDSVQLVTAGTYTIYAEDDTTNNILRDGYINSITFGVSPEAGVYNVRIAYPVGSGIYGTGARYVGYVNLAGADPDPETHRGNLAMVVVAGNWGQKVVNGAPTDVDPDTEVTRVFQAKALVSDVQGRFSISMYGDDASSGCVCQNTRIFVTDRLGDASGVGWNLDTTVQRDWVGVLTTVIASQNNGNAPIGGIITIGRDLSGSLQSATDFFSPITIGQDIASTGALIANADGDNAQLGGMFDARIIVGRTMAGTIWARKDNNAGVPRGEMEGDVWIRGDFTGTIIAEGGLNPTPGEANYIVINSNGRSPAGWDSGATLTIGSTSYSPGDYSSARIYWATNVRGDCNDDDAMDNGDIDTFVEMLNDRPAWRAAYPWLLDAELFVGDVGGSGGCSGDCAVDNGDIDCFVAMLLDPNLNPAMCATAP